MKIFLLAGFLFSVFSSAQVLESVVDMETGWITCKKEERIFTTADCFEINLERVDEIAVDFDTDDLEKTEYKFNYEDYHTVCMKKNILEGRRCWILLLQQKALKPSK